MPVDMGTKTVGGTGITDYLTWEAALADLALSLNGNVMFIQTSPTQEFNTAKPPSGFDFNFWHLTLKTDEYRHTGLGANDGRLIDFAHDQHGFDFKDIAGSVSITMEHLYTRRTTLAQFGKYDIVFDTDIGDWVGGQRFFRYLLLDGNGNNGNTGLRIEGSTNGFFDIHHCIYREYSSKAMVLAMNSFARVEHCSWIGDGGFDGFSSSGGEVTNCYGSGSSGADFANTSNLDGTNNGSADSSADNANWSTGIDNLTSLSTITEFISIIFTNEGFFRPFFNAAVVGGGSNVASINPALDLLEHKYPRTKTFVAPPSVQIIYTIGAQQPGILATDFIETEDQILFSGGTFRVDGEDVLQISEDDVSLKALLVSGSDVLEISETPDVVATHIVDAEDTVELLDAGVIIPLFECILDPLTLRRRTNFWFPTDTLANELTLPQPLPDDRYDLATRVRTRHAKGGDLRVYKRGAVLHTLIMNFVVERPHRDLALDFFELSSSQLVRLLDWEGRLWHGVVINTPIGFTAQGKSSNTEKFSFTIEFEGIRQ